MSFPILLGGFFKGIGAYAFVLLLATAIQNKGENQYRPSSDGQVRGSPGSANRPKRVYQVLTESNKNTRITTKVTDPANSLRI